MDWLAKQKIYSILIIVLIVINIMILALLWFDKPKPPEQFRQKPGDMNMFLQKELALSDEQEKGFEKLRQTLFDSTEKINQELRDQKRQLQMEAFSDNPDQSKVDSVVSQIASLQKQLEEQMFNHFSELKKVLNKEQLIKFSKLLDREKRPGDGNFKPDKGKNQPPPPDGFLPPEH